MNWRPRSSTVSEASRGATAVKSDVMELINSDGEVIFAVSDTTGGSASMELDGEAVQGSDAVSVTELSYLDGVTSAIQTQLDAKLASASVLRSYLDETVTYNANATLANTPLSVTVAAGGIYAIELVVHSTSAVKALNMDFGGTVTIANFIGWYESFLEDAGAVTLQNQFVSAAGTDWSLPAALDGGASKTTFTGSVEITDAGTFLLRGAQNVSDASNTTILRGSTLTLTKLN